MAKRTPNRSVGGDSPNAGEDNVAFEADTAAEPSSATADADPRWTEFAAKHSGHPVLAEETIYALPMPLIDALSAEIADFFSEAEQQFERDLAQLARGGFFLERSFVFPPYAFSDFRISPDHLEEERKQQAADLAESRQVLTDIMLAEGQNKLQAKQYFTRMRQSDAKLDFRRWSYAAWLATDPGYRRECGGFRHKWEHEVRKLKGFPTFPTSHFGETPRSDPQISKAFRFAYLDFYRRWGLDSLATWELPIPMWAGVTIPVFYSSTDVGQSGLHLFVPWYLLRDKYLNLHDLAQQSRLSENPHHLSNWLQHEPEKWGHERYRKMLKLYACVELCLRRRYPDRIKRNVAGIDRAFSRFFCEVPGKRRFLLEEETVRKIRLYLQRRLKQFEQAP